MNLFFVNLEGVRLIKIDGETVVPVVLIELEREVVGCTTRGVVAVVKDRRTVSLVDLTMVRRTFVLVCNKRRFRCAEQGCPAGTWTEVDERIAAPRLKMTDRAGRWATIEVGKNGRTVAEIAEHLGFRLAHHQRRRSRLRHRPRRYPERVSDVSTLGLDEHVMVTTRERRRQQFVTTIVDVDRDQLLDVVPDRKTEAPSAWLRKRGEEWLGHVRAGTLDLSSTYRSVFVAVLPHAELVADPFHVVRHATAEVDLASTRAGRDLRPSRAQRRSPLPGTATSHDGRRVPR